MGLLFVGRLFLSEVAAFGMVVSVMAAFEVVAFEVSGFEVTTFKVVAFEAVAVGVVAKVDVIREPRGRGPLRAQAAPKVEFG